ncbi:MAG: tRNA adenosine(34) deaminase TadA [Clostridia bacterium]|nr:tRNA adenosine(34) deaminase TadA [Clostridia bacterium]MBR7141890.1 tRNA adenosine(34) deaminase TadA [Clostridia bacterium]
MKLTQDEKYIKKCIALADKAAKKGDIPVGALVVCDGKIVARSGNRREIDFDPTAHAEIIVLRRAGKKLGRRNLSGCTLYVTLEPCVMCAGAIVNSRVDKVVFGAYDHRFGCCGSIMNLAEDKRFNHRAEVVGGVLMDECAHQISSFFRAVREKKKSATESSLTEKED